MICSWKLMIVNLWCHKCFCSTLVRMLWLRISLYSNWIFYGKYPSNLLFCYICKYDYVFPSQRAIPNELINKYHVNNSLFSLRSYDMNGYTWFHDLNASVLMILSACIFAEMNRRLFTCASSKFINCPVCRWNLWKMLFDAFNCSTRGRRTLCLQ